MTEQTSLVTIADRVRDFGIKMRATRTKSNPYMEDVWDGASHWRCTLTCGGRRMAVYFSQGSAHTEPPTAETVLNSLVLNSLALDATGIENARDFADWCAEYGYDTDSRKAERTYKATERITKSLKRLIDPLGATAWQNLLYHTESL